MAALLQQRGAGGDAIAPMPPANREPRGDAWTTHTPANTLGFYTSVAAGKGAPVLAVTLLQPLRPAAAAAWFFRYDVTPGKPDSKEERDPLDLLAQRVVADDAVGKAFRRFVATRGVRALLLPPNRGHRALRGLLQCPDAPPGAWTPALCAHGAERVPVLVRVQAPFEILPWTVFPRVAAFDAIARRGVDDVPALAAAHPRGHEVHFATMTTAKPILAARAARYAVLSVVHGQGGTWLAEPHVRFVPGAPAAYTGCGAWQEALAAAAPRTLVVGPLYFLAAASRYVRSLAAPATAHADVVRALAGLGGEALVAGALPPPAFLPPRERALFVED